MLNSVRKYVRLEWLTHFYINQNIQDKSKNSSEVYGYGRWKKLND